MNCRLIGILCLEYRKEEIIEPRCSKIKKEVDSKIT